MLRAPRQDPPRGSSSGGGRTGRSFGDYVLVKKLATGGMAEIWLARQRGIAGFSRFLVLKKILPHLAEQETFLRMFHDEARTSALLAHPNIVQIHALGQAEGTSFIAMEYIAGENLAQVAWRGLKRGSPFPVEHAARVVADACKALHYAHTLAADDGRPLGIVHRDISPQNILVTYDGEVKVVDFGIAKAASQTVHTQTGMLKGKYSYMSPEQCTGDPVDHRSDIFSLGILLYELVTGKRLFKHDSELMILDMITQRPVVPPSEVRSGVDPALEAVVLRALEKAPGDRFQSARQMQIALEQVLGRLPTLDQRAEIAAWMQGMFAQEIEEKRRLRERATRDDFERAFAEAPRAPTPTPTGPSDPGSTPQPRAGAGYRARPIAKSAGAEGRSRRAALAWLSAAALLFGLAGALLGGARDLGVEALLSAPRTPSNAPLPLEATITVASTPPGAQVSVDGALLRGPEGVPARTPVELPGLPYGETRYVKVEKAGHRPEVLVVDVGVDVDGKTFHPVLAPHPGHLVVDVRGLRAEQVEVRIDDEPVGSGPRVAVDVPVDTAVRVSARRAGFRCRAEPTEVRVAANRTANAVVSCTPEAPVAAAPDPAPRPRRRARRPRRAPPKDDCRPTPGLPPGFVTIGTEPYSTVYAGGERLGETPISSRRLPAGCVELEARTDDGRSRTVRIQVEPNMTRVYRFKL